MTDAPKCSKKFYIKMSSCSRKGVVERDGEWYCKQHDPVAIVARAKESYDTATQVAKARNRDDNTERMKQRASAELVKAALECWNHPAVDLYRKIVFDK